MACIGTASGALVGAYNGERKTTMPRQSSTAFASQGLDTGMAECVALTADVAATVSNLSKHRDKVAEGMSSARAAGLRYANRRGARHHAKAARQGLCLSWIRSDASVRDAKTLARIRALVLPPAWTDVWISTDPRAHLQATGRDAAGRKQYRYHAEWRSRARLDQIPSHARLRRSAAGDSPPHPPRSDGPGELPAARARHRRRIAGAHLHSHRQRRVRAQATSRTA